MGHGFDGLTSPAPASAGSPTNPPRVSPQGCTAETGAGEPRVLAVDLALEIATVAHRGTTYRLPIDDDRYDAGVIAPMWRRCDSAADAALSPYEDALTRDLTAFVRSEAA